LTDGITRDLSRSVGVGHGEGVVAGVGTGYGTTDARVVGACTGGGGDTRIVGPRVAGQRSAKSEEGKEESGL